MEPTFPPGTIQEKKFKPSKDFKPCMTKAKTDDYDKKLSADHYR